MSKTMTYIEWIDSCGAGGDSIWKDIERVKRLAPDSITSVGFVVASSKTHVTLAAHLGGNQMSGEMSIPKCAIKRMKHYPVAGKK